METHIGNILDLEQGILVHGCNAQGAFNAGLAQQIREKYYGAKLSYEQGLGQFNSYNDALGTVSYFKVKEDPWLIVINAITQKYYGRDVNHRFVSYDAVADSFAKIKKAVIATKQPELFEINFPLIGTGLGQGSWRVISSIIKSVFEDDERFKLHLWVLPGTVIPKD